MNIHQHIYNKMGKRLLLWLAAICTVVIFWGNANTTNSNEYEGGLTEEVEVITAKVSDPAKAKLTRHSNRHKRHFYIGRRNFEIGAFLKNSCNFLLSYCTSSPVAAPLSLGTFRSCFIRPSYYVLLFLYALY